MQEVWKDIGECKGYELFAGLYEVSNLGRIRSLDRWVRTSRGDGEVLKKGRVLSQSYCGSGYPKVMLSTPDYKVNAMVHRLVALAFLPNPNSLPCVNHKDEDKTNNRVSNLEWCTVRYNNMYNGRSKCVGVKRGVPVCAYDIDGNLVKKFDTLAHAGKWLGNKKKYSHISECAQGKYKTAYGYIWKYADEK